MYFSIFKDYFTFSRAILQNSRTNGTILKFQEFSRTKVKFKDVSRSVQTLPLQYTAILRAVRMTIFNKKCDIFLIFALKITCGYLVLRANIIFKL